VSNAVAAIQDFTVVRAHAHCRTCGRKGAVGAVRVNTMRAASIVSAANHVAWTWTWANQGYARPLVAFCARCCEPVKSQVMLVKKTAHKCGARCVSSTGHVCECACGGENHGVGA
jgi:hypothetical protein